MTLFRSITLSAFLAAPIVAHAQDNGSISSEIAANGLGATQTRLAALPAPTATDRFALGAVLFLGGVEHALQARWATNINGSLAESSGLPVLRLPLPQNPDAAAFTPQDIPDLFAQLATDMESAVAQLESISDADDVGLVINTADLWFDINSNGQRDANEGALEIGGAILTPSWVVAEPLNGIAVRFDTADAAWLAAYAHMVAGVSDIVLAVDPAEAIGRILDARAAMMAMSAPAPDDMNYFILSGFIDGVDVMAMIVGALDKQPDVALSRAAHAHFLGMIDNNRTFWFRVAAETDDDREWIPSKSQTSALPIAFPPDLAPAWQAVLADAEAMLKGDLLVPVWRMGDGAGVNLAAMFENPPPLNLIDLIQGNALVPYLETGPLITLRSLDRFSQLVSGRAGLYMALLN